MKNSALLIKQNWWFLSFRDRDNIWSLLSKQMELCALILKPAENETRHTSIIRFWVQKTMSVTHVCCPAYHGVPQYFGYIKCLLSKFLLSDRLIVIFNFCRIILFLKPLFPLFHLLCPLDLLSIQRTRIDCHLSSLV